MNREPTVREDEGEWGTRAEKGRNSREGTDVESSRKEGEGKRQGRGQGSEEEGGLEESELRVSYLNARRGRRQAEVALQIGSEKEAHVAIIAEALNKQERRPSHPTYDFTWNSKYMSVYIRKDQQIRVEGRGNGAWALIGKGVVAAYLPLQPRIGQSTKRDDHS